MENKKELQQKYLILLKHDATNLFNRIKERTHEFIEIFSLKRDKAIFKEVFRNRYDTMNMDELSQLPIEIIELANKFYLGIDELYWYLERTEDMPNTIEDEVIRSSTKLEKELYTLILYLDAELSGTSPE